MANRQPIQIGEWYHCYNRGVDKRKVFSNRRDYERMLLQMYFAREAAPVTLFHAPGADFEKILADTLARKERRIVEIGAYALMPNHIHFVLKEIQEGGIARFMQKVFTGYTMYFNQKNQRTGSLFAGTFKSKHVEDDRYLKHLISYVHLNPAELSDQHWKTRKHGTLELKTRTFLQTYRYSSLQDFIGISRHLRVLLDDSIFELFEKVPSLEEIIRDARTYEILRVADEV